MFGRSSLRVIATIRKVLVSFPLSSPCVAKPPFMGTTGGASLVSVQLPGAYALHRGGIAATAILLFYFLICFIALPDCWSV